MVAITLPDGSVRDYEIASSGGQIAADIGPGLAKAALAVRVDGALWDLGRPIEADATIAIVTAKDDDETVLGLIRHDAAHALAEAAKELYPDVQVTIGPNIDDGFYYDFSRGEPFTPDDLEKLEARMHEIV
ncbi:MAG: TGS domain-containing protein, partial [Alphaproteobacteria bacterium]|nr:TGS domain-containing protein [Alphaproteobacteria bacterium]